MIPQTKSRARLAAGIVALVVLLAFAVAYNTLVIKALLKYIGP